MNDWTTNRSSNKNSTLQIDLSLMEPVTYAAAKECFTRRDGDFFFIIMCYGIGDKNWRDQEKHCPDSKYYRHLDKKQRKTNPLVEFLSFSFSVLMSEQPRQIRVWNVYLLTPNDHLIEENLSWSPIRKTKNRAKTRIHPITTTAIKSCKNPFFPATAKNPSGTLSRKAPTIPVAIKRLILK